jgi:hypothetical protein
MKRQILLTTGNAKTVKGEKLGVKTYILYMSPFTQNSKGINLCSHASVGCAEACLFSSGMGGIYTHVQNARIKKSESFLRDRQSFLYQLKEEIEKAIRLNKDKFKVVFRLNGTTDIRYEKFKVFDNNTKNIFEIFPDVQFYDYTKNHLRFNSELPKNYHLTFSRSETNETKAFELLNKGYNVAMVFSKTPKVYKGFEVVNGDETDLRYLDKDNVIVGLKYKNLTGKGADNSKGLKSGFVIDTNHLTKGEYYEKTKKVKELELA